MTPERTGAKVKDSRGSLTIVGTGIQPPLQTTLEANRWIRGAQRLFFMVSDPFAEEWIRSENPRAESMVDLYRPGRPRLEVYRSMVERMLKAVRSGEQVCVAFYGHPGIFVWAAHEAIRQAREEGFTACMLPGVSAESCLFADLGLDPAATGCQSHEAQNFLLYHTKTFDPTCGLLLWQVGIIGRDALNGVNDFDPRGFALLLEVLCQHYPEDHEVVIYEAAVLPLLAPRIEHRTLADLRDHGVVLSQISTLFIPSLPRAPADPALCARLLALRDEAAEASLEDVEPSHIPKLTG